MEDSTSMEVSDHDQSRFALVFQSRVQQRACYQSAEPAEQSKG
jgi:hypothetical protein